MREITSWSQLRPFGIDYLTGEACGLGYRGLLDLTRHGRDIVRTAFGAPNMTLPEAWNGGSDSDPHVASIMLPFEMLPTIAIFALLESGYVAVDLYKNGTVRGIEKDDDPAVVQEWREVQAHFNNPLQRTFTYGGTAGSRNVHQMSGRVA